MLRQIKCSLQNAPITKNGLSPVTTFFFKKLCFSLRTFYEELICFTNNPNAHIRTFCKRWSFIWRCFFPVTVLNIATFCWKNTHTNKKQMKLKKEREKQKKPKKKRRNKLLLLWKVSAENLKWCDMDYKFALYVFNLRDRAVKFSWLFVWISRNLHVTREITVFAKL